MKEKITRRRLLYGAGLAGWAGVTLIVTNNTAFAADEPTGSQQIDLADYLLVILDNGDDKGDTTITVRNRAGSIVFTDVLTTKGSDHPDLDGTTLEERLPFITAGIDSFGGLEDGWYTVEVEHDGETETAEVQVVGKGQLADGNSISVGIEPNGEVDITVSHSDPGVKV